MKYFTPILLIELIKIKYWINSYNIAVFYFDKKYFNLLEVFSLLLGIKNFFEIEKYWNLTV